MDQLIYDHVARVCREIGLTVYETSPGEHAPYPYVRMGQAQTLPRATKSYYIGRVTLMLDVWGKDRRTVSSLAKKVLELSGRNKLTVEGLQIALAVDNSSIETRIDQTTNTDLWRSIVDLHFYFY